LDRGVDVGNGAEVHRDLPQHASCFQARLAGELAGDAARGLEAAFDELMGEFRRVYAQFAESVSPGTLPGTYKVLSMIQRIGSVTVSGLAERTTADKGQVSRAVSELEDLGLVARTADPDDGRIKLITLTAEGSRHGCRMRRGCMTCSPTGRSSRSSGSRD
jgi:DNA-binding MarR family transcriptional regulator